jgi:hypothetical protein
MTSVFIDQVTYPHVVGEGYTGFLYEFCTYTTATPVITLVTDSTCVADVECRSCPDNSTCLSTCAADEFIDPVTKACGSCMDTCPDGCVRGTDCRLCVEELCTDCTNWETVDAEEQCNTCVTNASVKDGVECSCDPGLTFFEEPGMCDACSSNCTTCDRQENCTSCEDGYYRDTSSEPDVCDVCSEECALCSDATNSACSECKVDFYQLPDTTTCVDYCPTLTTKDDTTHTCNDEPQDSVCFTFDDSRKALARAHPTETEVSLVPSSASEPTRVPQRGFYFESGQTVDIAGLILNTSFTVELYARVEAHGSLLDVLTTELSTVFAFGSLHDSGSQTDDLLISDYGTEKAAKAAGLTIESSWH